MCVGSRIWGNQTRTHFKIVFSSDIGVGASSQVLDILEYACGLILGPALISTENPNFELASTTHLKNPATPNALRATRQTHSGVLE